ncbi:hypothetical protein [Magnetospirillum sp. SS-4]|uniref:hypothetical protein n=1 Tax=Magnetospirillum sp. SS-4 TaxID=2681465 RepID=UPI0013861EEB|nr:hypothetical protein [Magnetospirillum sp. SS-4]CAA7625842.1 conserved hypothetical protein [Magnetospirillum sp. SS-4]
MAVQDDEDRRRLFEAVYRSLDQDSAADLDTFARHVLHNGALWDRLADAFPAASASTMRSVMMEAFAAWQKERQ